MKYTMKVDTITIAECCVACGEPAPDELSSEVWDNLDTGEPVCPACVTP